MSDAPHPEHPIANVPPSDAHPEHPIYYPPQIWGPPGPWPTPPIYMPQPPLGIWGPPGPWPTPPIYLPQPPPGVPTHPIYYPPQIWPSPGRPTHPIVLPPDQPPVQLPDPDSGFWVMSPGQPCVFVTADSPDEAASKYGRALQLTVGENLLVFTGQDAYVVDVTSDVQVSPAG